MSIDPELTMNMHVCGQLKHFREDALKKVYNMFKSLHNVPVTKTRLVMRDTRTFHMLMSVLKYRMNTPYPNAEKLRMDLSSAISRKNWNQIINIGIALKLLCLGPTSLLNIERIKLEKDVPGKVLAFGNEVLGELRTRFRGIRSDLRSFEKLRETYIEDLDRFGLDYHKPTTVLMGPYMLHICEELFRRVLKSLEQEFGEEADLDTLVKAYNRIYDVFHKQLLDAEKRNEKRRGLNRDLDPEIRLNGLMTLAVLADHTCPFLNHSDARGGRDSNSIAYLAGQLIIGLLGGSS